MRRCYQHLRIKIPGVLEVGLRANARFGVFQGTGCYGDEDVIARKGSEIRSEFKSKDLRASKTLDRDVVIGFRIGFRPYYKTWTLHYENHNNHSASKIPVTGEFEKKRFEHGNEYNYILWNFWFYCSIEVKFDVFPKIKEYLEASL